MSAANQNQLAPVSPILSGAAIGAAQSLQGLVFPFLPIQPVVPTASKGTIFVENSSGYMGSPQVVATALGADYPRRALGAPTTVLYSCEEYKLASDVVPQKLSERSQFPTSLTEREAGAIGRKLALDMEARTSSLFFSTANWPDAALAAVPGAGSQWDTIVTATPMQDLAILKSIVRAQSYGRDPDTLIIGREVADAFQRSMAASGVRIVTSGAAAALRQVATDAYLKELVAGELGLKLLIGGARRQSSADATTFASSYLWGKSIWMGSLEGADTIANASGDIMARAVAALLLVEDGLSGQGLSMDGLALPISVREYLTAPPQAVGSIVAGEVYSDEVVLDANLGYLVTAVVS
jgi:hypothetical protein